MTWDNWPLNPTSAKYAAWQEWDQSRTWPGVPGKVKPGVGAPGSLIAIVAHHAGKPLP
jgi:hypothetical protein